MTEHDGDPTPDPLVARALQRVGAVLKEKWRLDALLGVGGMAAVYAATHRNGKEAAVKLLHPEISLNANIRERFLREGYVANRVKQDGAVSVFDDDVAEDGSAFLVMELLEGETLEARRERKGGKLPASEVLSLADQVLDTLTAAHAHGIVHRDLKPENLFLTRKGTVKVLDFGIARLQELAGSASATQTGSMMGTPVFMPPEQARGRWSEVDGRSDLWALGASMFTLLTGEYVHTAETINEVLARAMMQPARSIASVDRGLPSEVVEFVDRALAYEKEQRWANAQSMQEALRAAYHAVQGAGASPRLSIPDVEQTSGSLPDAPPVASRASPAMTAAGVAASTHEPAPRSRAGVGIAVGTAVVVVAAAFVALRPRPAAVSEPPTSNATATQPVTTQAASPTPAPDVAVAPAASAVPPSPAPTVASAHAGSRTESTEAPKMISGPKRASAAAAPAAARAPAPTTPAEASPAKPASAPTRSSPAELLLRRR